ncbi:MAG TPA: hypothetical protein VN851_16205 [Thermoanaerobaculia bacterium]|nr:hypothetical protein [Thermoanaerobaculia bacterium]
MRTLSQGFGFIRHAFLPTLFLIATSTAAQNNIRVHACGPPSCPSGYTETSRSMESTYCPGGYNFDYNTVYCTQCGDGYCWGGAIENDTTTSCPKDCCGPNTPCNQKYMGGSDLIYCRSFKRNSDPSWTNWAWWEKDGTYGYDATYCAGSSDLCHSLAKCETGGTELIAICKYPTAYNRWELQPTSCP